MTRKNQTWIAVTGIIFVLYHIVSAKARAALNAGMAPAGMLDARFPTLDRLLPWTAEDAYTVLASLGEAGRNGYRDYLVMYDMGFSLVIMPMFFMAVLIALWGFRLALIGLLPALMDVLENLSILRILNKFPDTAIIAGTWGPVFTLLKWCGVLVVIGLSLVGALRLIVARFATSR